MASSVTNFGSPQQGNKIEQAAPVGLVESLSISKRLWESVFMDFIGYKGPNSHRTCNGVSPWVKVCSKSSCGNNH